MRRLQRKLEEFAGPRWPRWARLLIGLAVVAAGYACYRWRLMHAREFGLLGIAFIGALLLVRRALWKARTGRVPEGTNRL
jgi:hypothetical protein